MQLVQARASLRAEEVYRPDLPWVIVWELGVRVTPGEHHIGQGVPACLDGGQVLELAVGVRNGAQ